MANDLEPWEPKVGEPVRVVKNPSGCIADVVALTGRVDSISAVRGGISYDVILDGFSAGHSGDADDDSHNHLFFDAEDLAPVSTVSEPEPESKFQVGDFVRVVDNSLFSSGVNVGNMGIVTYSGAALVELLLSHPEDGAITQSCRPEDIELISRCHQR